MFTPEKTLLIAGVDVPVGARPTFAVNCPASGDIVSQWPSATLEDCNGAVEACAFAQPAWELVRPGAKRAIFLRASELVQSSEFTDRIRDAMQSETSAQANWIMANIMGSASLLEEVAAQAGFLRGEHIISESATCQMFVTQRRAAGVVLAISPWNSPILLAFRAVAIPLACGNSVVLKMSEFSPACGRVVVDVLLMAGIPRDVLAFVTFDRNSAPSLTSAMIAHPSVKRVNFTGSEEVGRMIAQQCGAQLKQCVLELGGSAPTLVFADADLRQAAKAIVSGGMLHGGQVCMSTERVFVEEAASEAFFAELKSVATDWTTKYSNKSALITPLLNPASAKRVLGLVARAISDGATDILATNSGHEGGSIVKPSILVNVKPTMEITHSEIFGPVIAVSTFSTEENAISLSNSSHYSLIASLWTRDLQRAMRVAPQIRSGSVQVNGSTIHSEPAFGLAGLGGSSGYGRFNVDSFTDLRALAFHGPGAQFPMM